MMSSGTPKDCDILFSGTGYFTEIMLADIAATARAPLRVVVGGRNAGRLKWLVDACRSRAAIYGTQASFDHVQINSEIRRSVEAVARSGEAESGRSIGFDAVTMEGR